MKRISDEKFIKEKYDKDSIIAMRVKDGEFYYIGMMEKAENYCAKIAKNKDACLLLRDIIIVEGDIQKAAELSDGWNRQFVIEGPWKTEEGKPVRVDDWEYENEYDAFLRHVGPYRRNGKTDGDHDIFVLSKEELAGISDTLRDGDYVFVMV